ncbi:hypothetical protein [Lysinibacillus sp. FSL M8-0134]|uniref:hypothetical protein n=1 Tax=Lysinibacillus sp. FSL M8-0134 TaxID=2921717 RepID=UPI00311A783A
MRIVYFKRLSDQKEIRFLQVKNTGLEGVAKDGEVVTLKFAERSTLYSHSYTK